MCEWYSLIIHCAGIKGIVLFLLFALICNLTTVSRLTQLLDQAFGCDDTASPAENWSRPVLSPRCSSTTSDLCAFEHAALNCASCLNNISMASTQVPHWRHARLDWVIEPAVCFIVCTLQNGDICGKPNKNIPGIRYAPGISSPTPYHSLSALVCFYRTALFQWVDTDPVLVNGVVFLLNGWH